MFLKKTILVVDDKIVNRQILRRFLADEYEIIESKDGAEALKVIDDNSNISAVLLDLVMPVMDGYEVLERMRSRNNMTIIPVLAVSKGEEDTELRSLSMGAWDFVGKPYKPQVIKQRLKNIIQLNETKEALNVVERDSLTGLFNKEGFYHNVAALIRSNPQHAYNIIVIDIEHFKLVNDTYGVNEGDKLLKYMAVQIEKVVEKYSGICARANADRFFLLLPTDVDMNHVIEQYQNSLFRYPIAMKIYVKFGIYEIDDISIPVAGMCDRASLALSSIKGRYDKISNYYDDILRKRLLLEQQIINDMDRAIKEHQFTVYLQPKYDLKTEEIAGAEALIRWNHPVHGFLFPNNFIPIYEKNGFITDVDTYVWDKTCEVISDWKKQGLDIVPVSVNVSRKDIYNTDLPKLLEKLVAKYNLEPKYLHLEITETAYTEDSMQLIEGVLKLKESGFIIEMDDFGSGYSSLNMITELPIDVLKLDMRFIQAKQKSGSAQDMIEFVINLAKRLELKVTAEGVETRDQVELLRSLQCDYAQGYYYSKPVPCEDVAQLLIKSNNM